MPGCTNCPTDRVSQGDREDQLFRRVLWIALVINCVMFVVEITASQRGDPMSLQADALDFFGDAANHAISLFVLGMALAMRARAALVANIAVAVLLFRYRGGDSNLRSIWLCSRNDAIGNIAVMEAATGVFLSTSRWPDLIVAAIIAGLNIGAAFHVIRLAPSEFRDHSHALSVTPS